MSSNSLRLPWKADGPYGYLDCDGVRRVNTFHSGQQAFVLDAVNTAVEKDKLIVTYEQQAKTLLDHNKQFATRIAELKAKVKELENPKCFCGRDILQRGFCNVCDNDE